jgi:type VI secretion system FHA domain protein
MPLTLRIENRPDLPAAGRERVFSACGGTIGRAGENDWVLPDSRRYVSSRHAIIDFQAGAYYLVDTSRNGVYVNGADTPVGHGHPQRLFDGDRLRIGELEISVGITADDASIPDDGMRDSIVRAQLVPEEPSVELQLMAEDKLLGDALFQQHLSPGTDLLRGPAAVATPARPAARPAAGGGTATALATARGRSTAPATRAAARAAAQAPAAAAPAPAPARDPAEKKALELLLAAAGLKPDAVAGATPAEVLQLAGQLLRLTVGGLMELLKERSTFKDTFRIPQTLIQPVQNNPLKFSPNVEEALRYLLNDRGESGYLGARDAVQSAYQDLRQHEQASLRALVRGVVDYAEQFDPEELRQRFDKGLKRGGILGSANRLKYWELYEELFPALVQREEGAPPAVFSEHFARAYADELEGGRNPRGR